jgi:hypothetical protein
MTTKTELISLEDLRINAEKAEEEAKKFIDLCKESETLSLDQMIEE